MRAAVAAWGRLQEEGSLQSIKGSLPEHEGEKGHGSREVPSRPGIPSGAEKLL